MILIGHPDVQSKLFYAIKVKEEISLTPAHSPLFLPFDISLCAYCFENKLIFGVHVKSIKELILAHALGASFLMVDTSLALNAQKIANEYLFDAKILLLSENDDTIEFCALHGIDGILFSDSIQSPPKSMQ